MANMPQPIQPHSSAWIAQTWISFIVAVGITAMGIWFLPVDVWVKAFMVLPPPTPPPPVASPPASAVVPPPIVRFAAPPPALVEGTPPTQTPTAHDWAEEQVPHVRPAMPHAVCVVPL